MFVLVLFVTDHQLQQAYYQHKDTLGRQRMKEEKALRFIMEIRHLDPGISGEKIHVMYRKRFGSDYEYMVGRDKMEAIISRNGLNVRTPFNFFRVVHTGLTAEEIDEL